MPDSPQLPLFRTKICGVTRASDVASVIAAGGDAIGLNFYPKSRRYLAEPQRTEVLRAIDEAGADRPQRVGVFVNESADTIMRIAEACSLDWIQLHGKEPPDFSLQLPGYRIVRAIGYGEGGLAEVRHLLKEMEAAGCLPDAILLDAQDTVQFGGTGRVLPWSRLQSELTRAGGLTIPWVLAGGLTADNVREAILAVRPDGVDVASGVEVTAGHKDPTLVAAFVANARSARQEIGD